MTEIANIVSIITTQENLKRRPQRHARRASSYSGGGPDTKVQKPTSHWTCRQYRLHMSVDTAHDTPVPASNTISSLLTTVALRDGVVTIVRTATPQAKSAKTTKIAVQSGPKLQ